MRPTYKYYSGVTSQIPFCSTPLRLDTYNSCQFACAYCFASTRQGFGRNERLQIANPASLLNRLKRVQSGDIQSSLDEMISQRIPFQLGGMSDPFTAIEKKERITFQYLEILKNFDYPYLVSTKNSLISNPEYLDLLKNANAYVRFSTTVTSNDSRSKIDVGCPEFQTILSSASELTKNGIPVSFRFQPIIPSQEEYAYKMVDLASTAGVRHISAEYLKVPIDADLNFGPELKKLLSNRPIASYKNFGAQRHGREYILPITYKAKHLPSIYRYIHSKGMTFGFADNELLLHSDGASCCNAANLYLRDAKFFKANITGLAKSKMPGDYLHFDEYLNEWIPQHSVSNYFNSKSRIEMKCYGEADWLSYLRKMWIGEQGVFSPDYFDGIANTHERDSNGLPIYRRVESEFEKLLK